MQIRRSIQYVYSTRHLFYDDFIVTSKSFRNLGRLFLKPYTKDFGRITRF